MNLLNKYIPDYTFNEYHHLYINAGQADCFKAAKSIDLSKSGITKFLLILRGLPTEDLSISGFLKNMRFTIIEEKLRDEFLIDASQPGIIIFWNFHFKSISASKTLVSTETRILCFNKKLKKRFSLYWFFIKPFSGLIRLKMLKLIKKEAEKIKSIN